MRKFNVMACALTSALAVSLGSFNVLASSQVSAPAATEDFAVSGDASALEQNEHIKASLNYDEGRQVLVADVSSTDGAGKNFEYYFSMPSSGLGNSGHSALVYAVSSDKIEESVTADGIYSLYIRTADESGNAVSEWYRVGSLDIILDAGDTGTSSRGGAVVEAQINVTSNISYNSSSKKIVADFEGGDLVHFTKYTWLFGDKVLEEGELDGSNKGELSLNPYGNGSYHLNVNYNYDPGMGGTSTEDTLEMDISVSSVSQSGASAEKNTSDSDTSVAAAPSGLNGAVNISYYTNDGILKAVSDVKGSKSFKWYKDSSEVSSSQEYTPTEEGSYYCIMTDNKNASDKATSKTIRLYKVSGDDKVTFNSPNGLYEAGSTVTATAKAKSGEQISGWKCSIKQLDVSMNGNTATFRMPNRSMSIKPKTSSAVKISVTGGKASKKKASKGDKITIMADRKDGKQFSRWNISGADKVEDANSSVTKITVGTSDITATAEYTDVTSSSDSSSSSYSSYSSYDSTPIDTTSSSSSSHEADAKHAVYEVLDAGGYNVKVEHHSQGPLCDAAFKYSQAHDYLVTDYFNITVNDSLTTYEIPNSVKIKLTIPSDLQQSGRKWRMLCISKGGTPYSFDDEDNDDSTITFTTNRFYAYAMCYSDYVEPVVEYTEPDVVDLDYDDTSVSDDSTYDPYSYVDTSVLKPREESQIVGEGGTSQIYGSEYSNTTTIYDGNKSYDTIYTGDYGTGSDGSYGTDSYSDDTYSAPVYDMPSESPARHATPIQSDKKPAINNSSKKNNTVFSL